MSGSPTPRARRRSFASLGGYSGIAGRWGLRLCACGSDGPGNHEMGWTAHRMRVIHWSDRPVTRRGLYRFHKLLAQALHREADLGPPVTVIYQQNVIGAQLALDGFGLRFPREFADHDRARVRLLLSKLQPRALDEFMDEPGLHRRISEWARQ